MKSLWHFLRNLFQKFKSEQYDWHITAFSIDQDIAVLGSTTIMRRQYVPATFHSGVHIYASEMIFERSKLHPTFEPLEHISRATQKLPLTIIAWNNNKCIQNVWLEEVEQQLLYPDRLIARNVKLFGDAPVALKERVV